MEYKLYLHNTKKTINQNYLSCYLLKNHDDYNFKLVYKNINKEDITILIIKNDNISILDISNDNITITNNTDNIYLISLINNHEDNSYDQELYLESFYKIKNKHVCYYHNNKLHIKNKKIFYKININNFNNINDLNTIRNILLLIDKNNNKIEKVYNDIKIFKNKVNDILNLFNNQFLSSPFYQLTNSFNIIYSLFINGINLYFPQLTSLIIIVNETLQLNEYEINMGNLYENLYNINAILNNTEQINSIRIGTSVNVTSFNPLTPETNTFINSQISTFTNIGFNIFNNRDIIRNTYFGNYMIIENEEGSFKIKYTINEGRIWSDGTPINAIDLLLNHIISSSQYSIDSGLGDPNNDDETPKFNSIGYGGFYDKHIVGDPEISEDKMSLTLTYDTYSYLYEILSPSPFPVHALVHLLNEKISTQPIIDNIIAKEYFLELFVNKNQNTDLTEKFRLIGHIWSTFYNLYQLFGDVNYTILDSFSDNNSIFAISNGGYIFNKLNLPFEIVLIKNKNYNCGPPFVENAINKIKILESFDLFFDLKNNAIDAYFGSYPTSTSGTSIDDLKTNCNVYTSVSATYEHLDLRVGPSILNSTGPYNGPFAGMSQQAKDLRKAFLLTIPREKFAQDFNYYDEYDNLIYSFQNQENILNSNFLFQGDSGYNEIISRSHINEFTDFTQEERIARALELVRQYYPDASENNYGFSINLLCRNNSRRLTTAYLIQKYAKKSGINVNITARSDWSVYLDFSTYDASIFGWAGNGGLNNNALGVWVDVNNHGGYINPTFQDLINSLNYPLSKSEFIDKCIQGDNYLIDDAITLPLYQWRVDYVINKRILGIRIDIYQGIITNYWNWYVSN